MKATWLLLFLAATVHCGEEEEKLNPIDNTFAFAAICDTAALDNISTLAWSFIGNMLEAPERLGIPGMTTQVINELLAQGKAMEEMDARINGLNWDDFIGAYIGARIVILVKNVKKYLDKIAKTEKDALKQGEKMVATLRRLNEANDRLTFEIIETFYISEKGKRDIINRAVELFAETLPDPDYISVTFNQYSAILLNAASGSAGISAGYPKAPKDPIALIPDALCLCFEYLKMVPGLVVNNLKVEEEGYVEPTEDEIIAEYTPEKNQDVLNFIKSFFETFIKLEDIKVTTRGLCLLDKDEANQMATVEVIYKKPMKPVLIPENEKQDIKPSDAISADLDKALQEWIYDKFSHLSNYSYIATSFVINLKWLFHLKDKVLDTFSYTGKDQTVKTLADKGVLRAKLYTHYAFLYLAHLGVVTKNTTLEVIFLRIRQLVLKSKCWANVDAQEDTKALFDLAQAADLAELELLKPSGDCGHLQMLLPPPKFVNYFYFIMKVSNNDSKVDEAAKKEISDMFVANKKIMGAYDLKYLDRESKDPFAKIIRDIILGLSLQDYISFIRPMIDEKMAKGYLTKADRDKIVNDADANALFKVFTDAVEALDANVLTADYATFTGFFRTVDFSSRAILYIFQHWVSIHTYPTYKKLPAHIKIVQKDYQQYLVTLARPKGKDNERERGGFRLFNYHAWTVRSKTPPIVIDKALAKFRAYDLYFYHYSQKMAGGKAIKKPEEFSAKTAKYGDALFLPSTIPATFDNDYWAIVFLGDLIDFFEMYLESNTSTTRKADFTFFPMFLLMYYFFDEIRSKLNFPVNNSQLVLWRSIRACLNKPITPKNDPFTTKVFDDFEITCNRLPGEYGKMFYFIYVYLESTTTKEIDLDKEYEAIETQMRSKENRLRIPATHTFLNFVSVENNTYGAKIKELCENSSFKKNAICSGIAFFDALMAFIKQDIVCFEALNSAVNPVFTTLGNVLKESSAVQGDDKEYYVYLQPFLIDAYVAANSNQRKYYKDTLYMSVRLYRKSLKQKEGQDAFNIWSRVLVIEDPEEFKAYTKNMLNLVASDKSRQDQLLKAFKKIDINSLIILKKKKVGGNESEGEIKTKTEIMEDMLEMMGRVATFDTDTEKNLFDILIDFVIEYKRQEAFLSFNFSEASRVERAIFATALKTKAADLTPLLEKRIKDNRDGFFRKLSKANQELYDVAVPAVYVPKSTLKTTTVAEQQKKVDEKNAQQLEEAKKLAEAQKSTTTSLAGVQAGKKGKLKAI